MLKRLSNLEPRALNAALVAVFGFFVLFTAIHAVGYHHADERYQIIEFANHFLGNVEGSQLSWEFQYKIRPTIQPLMAAFLISVCKWFGVRDAFDVMVIIRVLTGLFAMVVYLDFIKGLMRRHCPKLTYIWVVGAFGLWYMPYLMIRFSSENFASLFFLLGYSSLILKTNKNFLLSGIFLGLSFAFRFQIGIAIAGITLYLVIVESIKWKYLLQLILGGSLVLVALVLLDRVFYNEWVFTPWKYVQLQLMEGRAAGFGVDPWWKYFEFLWEGLTWVVAIPLLIGIVVLFVKKRTQPFFFVVIPFLVVHLFIGHKELRFLYPVLFCVPLILFELMKLFEYKWRLQRMAVAVVLGFSIINIAGMVLLVPGPSGVGRIKLAEYVYDKHTQEPVLLFYKNYCNPFEPWAGGNHAYFYHNTCPNVKTKFVEHLEDINKVEDSRNEGHYLIARQLDFEVIGKAPTDFSERFESVSVSYSELQLRVGRFMGLINEDEVYYLFRLK